MEPQLIGSSYAEIQKVTTNIDGSARITIDLPEISKKLVSQILELKMSNEPYIHITIVKGNDNE